MTSTLLERPTGHGWQNRVIRCIEINVVASCHLTFVIMIHSGVALLIRLFPVLLRWH